MRYYADLHVHSKYSRACSRDCDLEHLAWWARRKGITVLGTGDFTHPAWAEHLRSALVPAEAGLFKLRDDLDREVLRTLPPSCHGEVRFLLQVEISTIYKRDGKTRKVHHLCYVPDFDAAEEFTRRLARIGNLKSDGRPILGLDSRDLLEITLESGDGAYLVPAHAWTPWFAVLGSKSGFDAVEDCYADLADHVFALETGLSSDPEMNWRVSRLDRFRLVSNSDAHSPPMLARNATVYDTELDYFALRRALQTGEGYVGTVDMFPEEGKYHLDGHRKCGVRLEPAETKAHHGDCPECGKPLTVGVLHRVDDLADRAPGERPDTAGEFLSLIPLPEIMGEILRVGPKSKAVQQAVSDLVGRLGPELAILLDLPMDRVREARSPLLSEAVERLRAGKVHREAGYDGEYGTISVFSPGEIDELNERVVGLFEAPEQALFAAPARPPFDAAEPRPRPAPKRPEPADSVVEHPPVAPQEPTGSLLDGLDPDQRAAAATVDGPLLIVAGPGTGKTRTLTHRLAHLVAEHGVDPEHCLAITFTRRACEELRERLAGLVPEQAPRITVQTFHGLGLNILRERPDRAGLGRTFAVADDAQRLAVLRDLVSDEREARRCLETVSQAKRIRAARFAAAAAGESAAEDGFTPEMVDLLERYTKTLHGRNLVDFDDLVALPVTLLAEHADLREHYRDRFRRICVDEYQDVDELQYRLLRLLTPAGGHLCAIGDPDQAIYRFRGADVGFFLRFRRDFPTAREVQLTRNYRSSKVIVAAAVAAVAPSTLVPDRELHAMRALPAAERVGLHAAADQDAEARFVVDTIEELLGGSSFHSRDSGRVTSDGFEHGLSFDDIAVLYRTDAQARPIAEALSREGLPFQKRSHNRIADHAGVQTVLRHLTGSAADEPLPLAVRRAAQRAIDELDGDLFASSDNRVYAEQLGAIREAVDLLTPLATAHADDPRGFHGELTLGAEVDTWDPRADRISLLTLHAAKGLEFPVVFLVGCAEGLLPLRWPGAHLRSTVDDLAAEEAEERRLFFVGISRARSHLYLSHPLRRTRAGQTSEVRPSSFLSALGDDLIERLNRPGASRSRSRTQQLRLL
ncbi:UvrD-helicase domain-containing protein [Gandjariella thermophila]|uniref:DNA 3'-5' helicase n=1 Tax=Gandjariella thermophila TaxID=1931992 RepID=A0A4D4JDI0_9PSEU|nr:UvrD-helicase domain-containing protein [Gandjariella thermophila]GDY31957.1 DNA helicase [Gandjariella thermophila]